MPNTALVQKEARATQRTGPGTRGPETGGRGPGARAGSGARVGCRENWGSPELGLARQTGRSLDFNMAFGMDVDDFRWVFIGN